MPLTSFRTSIALAILIVSFVGAGQADDYILHEFEKIPLTQKYYSEGAAFGDFNHDGQQDAVYGPFWYEAPGFKTRHRFYDGKEFPNDKGYSDNFFSFSYDFNGDGWADILTLGFPSRQAYWYANPKNGDGGWKRSLAFPGVDNESPTFGDITGDGQPEIVCSTKRRLGYATFDPDAPTEPWTFHPISDLGPWAPFTHGLGLGDVNDDGRSDMLTAHGWLEQPESLDGDPLWTPHVFHFGPGGSQMFAYDVDGDGDNDVITALQAHAWGLSWFEHVKTDDGSITFKPRPIMGGKPEQNAYGVAFSQPHAVNLVDVDGDGLKDILTGKCYWAHNGHDPGARDPAVLYYFRLTRGEKGVSFIPHKIDDDSGVGRQVEAGDFNGDNLTDVIVGNKKGAFVFRHTTRKVNKAEWQQAQPKLYDPATAVKKP